MKMLINVSLNVQRISDDILSLDDGILSVSIMDARTGTTLAVSSKTSFRNQYKITESERKNSGAWAIVILGLVREVRNTFGDTKAIISVHKKCKLILIPSHLLLIGLVVQRSTNAEDYIVNKIETMLTSDGDNDIMSLETIT